MLADDKYSEKGVPPMVLAQRDFIKKEKEFFAEECVKWNFILLFLVLLCTAGGVAYFKIFNA
jgi:hypothetical protein